MRGKKGRDGLGIFPTEAWLASIQKQIVVPIFASSM